MPLLEVRDLQFTAPGSAGPTVRVAELSLEPGARVVVRGPSGSGKTSLLRCIVGLERTDRGTVRWRGRTVSDAEYPHFRADCCYMPQKPVGTAPTVAEDLAFARERATQHAREGALDEAGQRERLEALGLGGLPWDRAYDRLSTGEQQRVALVRALTLSPTVLLLDEPAAALDPERVQLVERMLLDYVAHGPERALVWVSHHPEQIERVATRVHELVPPAAREDTDG